MRGTTGVMKMLSDFTKFGVKIEIDIEAEKLFNTAISLQLVGQAKVGLSKVQAYYYDRDYVNLFTQEVADNCLAELPKYLLTSPTRYNYSREILNHTFASTDDQERYFFTSKLPI